MGVVRLPAFVDIHVHFREPGFPDKEDIESGVRAAAAGGYRAVNMMPNTSPAIDCPEALLAADRRGRECGDWRRLLPGDDELPSPEEGARTAQGRECADVSRRISAEDEPTLPETGMRTGRGRECGAGARRGISPVVAVFAASAMTLSQAGKELVDFDSMDSAGTLCREQTGHGVCGITEDGKTLYDYRLMEKACEAAARLGLPVMSHAEPEADIIRRDIGLARKTGARFHFQHISLAESVELVRAAKAEGLPVTCETAPHYFALTDADVPLVGANAKMNPPLRTERDRRAIIEGLADGVIDCIATDHAPHEAAAKNQPFEEAANGVIGLETAFPVSYTVLVKGGFVSLDRLVQLMSTGPAGIIGLPPDPAAMIEAELETPWVIDSSAFLSKGRNTPFDGMRVYGRIL